MGIATGFTAERMQMIEDASVVDGDVVGDNLILTRHDGSTINAGSVRGPVGADASVMLATPKPASDIPSTYPLGISTFDFGTESPGLGYPVTLGFVFTSLESPGRGMQIVTEKANGTTDPPKVWIRTVGQDVWGAFQRLATIDSAGLMSVSRIFVSSETDVGPTSTLPPFQIGDDAGPNLVIDGNEVLARDNGVSKRLYVEGGITTTTLPEFADDLTRKDYVDKFGTGIELAGSVDLNTITTAGNYTQSQSSEASSGTNYPEAQAGLLEVFNNSLGAVGMVWQRYTPYGTNVTRFWQRSYYSGYAAGSQWSPWILHDANDTGWITLTISNTTNFSNYGSSPGPQIRRIGKMVNFKGALNLKVAGVADATSETSANQFTTIPSGYLPADATNHSVWVCQGSSLNRWQLRINATGAAYAGRYGPSGSIVNSWLPFNVTWFID